MRGREAEEVGRVRFCSLANPSPRTRKASRPAEGKKNSPPKSPKHAIPAATGQNRDARRDYSVDGKERTRQRSPQVAFLRATRLTGSKGKSLGNLTSLERNLEGRKAELEAPQITEDREER